MGEYPRFRLPLKSKTAVEGVTADGKKMTLFKAVYSNKVMKLTIYCTSPPPYVLVILPLNTEKITEYAGDEE